MADFKLPKVQGDVLAMLVEDGGRTSTRQLAEKHNIKPYSAANALSNLYIRGILTRSIINSSDGPNYYIYELAEGWEAKAQAGRKRRRFRPDHRVTSRMHKVYRILERGPLKLSSIVNQVGMSVDDTREQIEELCDAGYVKLADRENKTSFKVTDKALVYDPTDAQLRELFSKMATPNAPLPVSRGTSPQLD